MVNGVSAGALPVRTSSFPFFIIIFIFLGHLLFRLSIIIDILASLSLFRFIIFYFVSSLTHLGGRFSGKTSMIDTVFDLIFVDLIK